MDGNRRWARTHKMELMRGHSKGADVIRPIVEYGAEQGLTHITFWAFSTENWRRNSQEVEYLMRLFREFITGRHVRELMENGVRLNVIGDISQFPGDIPERVEEAVEKSRDNARITVTMALNYGGRAEITQAVNAVVRDIKDEKLNKESIEEKDFEKYLYTADMPDPDIIIRTGGEKRLSGYLPWQSVYAELFFTDTHWPDFTPEEFAKILNKYAGRVRRFGK